VGFLLPFSLAVALGKNPIHNDYFAIIVPVSMVICASIGAYIVGKWAQKESRRVWVIVVEAIATVIVLHTAFKLLFP
jgi:CDP-diglyceride synthetase